MSDHRRLFLTFPLVILICALLGGAFGPSLDGVPVASAASDDDIQKSLKIFTKVYDVVSENSAEQLDPDKAIYKGAIIGMLRTLDPHSSFFDPRDFRLLREDQRGHYFGVGMIVAPRSGKTIVIAPFPGSPAYKGGIRPGDVILEVNDRRTDNLTTTEVADLLKGPRGTAVQVVVARPGAEKPITFNIVRDEIPRKSVQDAFWLKPGVAYLDIDSFNENTGKEVEDNLKRLGEQNIEALILDLRDNP
ncbi:MAG: PDZ domain-containing protein, partial [Bryobacteraceae bacterium]|nr:PDZ domain-containing protein [Bryobacteraceae bacterium]